MPNFMSPHVERYFPLTEFRSIKVAEEIQDVGFCGYPDWEPFIRPQRTPRTGTSSTLNSLQLRLKGLTYCVTLS